MKISIIVPTYNEARYIKSFQERLGQIIDNTLEEKTELIFVDGKSQDNTLELIDPKYKVINSQKGRGNQLNEGAKASSGEVLFFLHCDSALPIDFEAEIQQIMKISDLGCFGIEFDEKTLIMKICAYLSNRRITKKGIAFGDQGIFIKKHLFNEIGGFKNLPIMEDFQFSLDLKAKGIKYKCTKSKIISSSRRYKGNIIHKFKIMYQMYTLRKLYLQGIDINIINQKYKDIR